MAKYITTYYRYKEEILNVTTHLIGLLLSIAATVILIVDASLNGNAWNIVSNSIFGATMITLYLASTLYHYSKNRKLRQRLNVFDHSAIYLLIAGTYTPFCLVALRGPMGWVLFGITWGLAVIGIIFKIQYTGRYNRLSTILYVSMGWIAIIAIKPLIDALSFKVLMFMLIGGISYTIGAVFYLAKIKYNHAIFHVFVLGGTIMHFFAVLYLI